VDFGRGSVRENSAGGMYALFEVKKHISDLFKVFESVVPSERTSLSLAIADVSIKAYAPSHPGAAVLHIGEAEINTELAGNSSEFKLNLLVPSLSFLLVDSIADALASPNSAKPTAGSSLSMWKVSSPLIHK
jgi:autophagy-related protein 2